MKEIHIYRGQPEPGYEERLREKLTQYVTYTPGTTAPDFRIWDIYEDYPDLPTNEEFFEVISTTAEGIRRKLEQDAKLQRLDFP